jgi:CRP-like cAMP-binding protein
MLGLVPRPRDIDIVALRALQVKHGATYPAGHILFHEGESGDTFYVILDGEVEMLVTRPDGVQETVAILARGDFFGEMAVFRREPRVATARTRTAAALLFFGERTAADLLVTSPKFAVGIIRALCDRVGALDQEVVTLRHDVGALRALAGLEQASSAAASAATG